MRLWGLLIAAVAGIAACNALSGVDDLDFSGARCLDDLSCPPPDACKVGHCDANGACAFVALPDGLPPTQVPGDCAQVRCAGGEPASKPDATDVDDGNPCTADACDGGEPKHDKLDKVPCGSSGVCNDGVCDVVCTSATDDCDEGNPCTTDVCDLAQGKCVHEAAHGKLVSNEDPHDCNEVRCVHDKATSVPNETEVPDDENECTLDACEGGAAQHTPAPQGTACGSSLAFTCNGQGQCVGCNDPTDCSGTDTECQQRTCTAGVCGTSYASAGTVATNGQTPADCQLLVCDGTGNLVSQADDGDVPTDEGNTCTSETCSGGNPVHPPVSPGAPCNGGVCNVVASCVECITEAQCNGNTQPCYNASCANNTCLQSPAPISSPDPACAAGAACDGNGACKKTNGQMCVSDAECISNNCCSIANQLKECHAITQCS